MTFPPEIQAAVYALVAYVVGIIVTGSLDLAQIDLSEQGAALVTAIANIILVFLAGLLTKLDANLVPLIVNVVVLILGLFATYANRKTARATLAIHRKASVGLFKPK